MAENIEFKCPHCSMALQAGSDLAGQKCKCPKCTKDIIVPGKDTQSPDGKKEASNS